MAKIVAKNINTELWYSIIKSLRSDHWQTRHSYTLFDKGIDYDKYILIKNGSTLKFIWDNWNEGEIKGTKKVLDQVEDLVGEKFEYGISVHFVSFFNKIKRLNIFSAR